MIIGKIPGSPSGESEDVAVNADGDRELSSLFAERPTMQSEDEQAYFGFDAPTKVEPPSDTVLKHDLWAKRRGRELAKDKDFKQFDEHVVSDMASLLFEVESEYAENPKDPVRAAWTKQLEQTPEFRALHRETCLDVEISAIASAPLNRQWVAYVAEQKKKHPGDPAPGSDEESITDQLDRMKSTAEALKQAKQDVNDAKDMADGIGFGGDGSYGHHGINRQRLAAFFKKGRDNKRLQKIMQMLGRYKRLARSLQKRKSSSGRGEITGIELSGDVSRLIPRELTEIIGGLGEEMQDRALYRLLRRRSMSYKHKKVEPVQSGPFVLHLDGSGSMGGEKIIQGKAIAACLAYLATHQNRWCILVEFYAGKQAKVLCLPPRHQKQDELLDWLCHFYNGGDTDLITPCLYTPFELWPTFVEQGLPRGKTDHIIITDDCLSCSDAMAKKYNQWGIDQKVKTYGICIGGRDSGEIAKVCQKVWCVDDLGLNEDAVQEVLSI